jgi:hypothetical protein
VYSTALSVLILSAIEESNLRFGDVRNGIVAHRDASVARQLALIEIADQEQITDLAIRMLQATNELLPLMDRMYLKLREVYTDYSS